METNQATTNPKSRKRSIIVFVVTNILIIGVLVLLWTQLTTPASTAVRNTSPDDTLISAGDAPSPLIGKAAPSFALSTINGNNKSVSLADYKGKPVIINFWASWCDPCVRETPFLQRSWPDLQSKGIGLLGVDGGEPSSAGVKFLQKYGVGYPNVADTVGGDTLISYGVTNKPETFFIDRNGKVVAHWIGEIDAAGLQQELAKLQGK